MAEKRAVRRASDEDEQEPATRDEYDEDGRGDAREDGGGRRSGLTARQAAKAALRQLAELAAKSPEGIVGLERTEDGWRVGIEVVEDRRIPSSTDLLATYETTIDGKGELVSYRRVRRYSRGHGDDGGEG
jgi:Gas vesicle synthesis protein GvpO